MEGKFLWLRKDYRLAGRSRVESCSGYIFSGVGRYVSHLSLELEVSLPSQRAHNFLILSM